MFQRHFRNGLAGDQTAGVVHQNIDTAKGFDRFGHQRLDIFGFVQIALNGNRLAALLFNLGDGGLGPGAAGEIVDHQIGALGRQLDRAGAPDVAAAAGDNCCFSFEFHRSQPLAFGFQFCRRRLPVSQRSQSIPAYRRRHRPGDPALRPECATAGPSDSRHKLVLPVQRIGPADTVSGPQVCTGPIRTMPDIPSHFPHQV